MAMMVMMDYINDDYDVGEHDDDDDDDDDGEYDDDEYDDIVYYQPTIHLLLYLETTSPLPYYIRCDWASPEPVKTYIYRYIVIQIDI